MILGMLKGSPVRVHGAARKPCPTESNKTARQKSPLHVTTQPRPEIDRLAFRNLLRDGPEFPPVFFIDPEKLIRSVATPPPRLIL